MVDLSNREEAGKKRQRAFHLSDVSHERLSRAASLAKTTMSAILEQLIWEDLRLPGDDEVVGAEIFEAPPAPPTGRELEIAERVNAQAPAPAAVDRNSPDELNRRAMERLRKNKHYATQLDGSDQPERDPTNDGKGGDKFDF